MTIFTACGENSNTLPFSCLKTDGESTIVTRRVGKKYQIRSHGAKLGPRTSLRLHRKIYLLKPQHFRIQHFFRKHDPFEIFHHPASLYTPFIIALNKYQLEFLTKLKK